MKITLSCDGLKEQMMLYDLLEISSLIPDCYRIINNAGEVDPTEPVTREIEIEIDNNEAWDRKTVSNILNFWAKYDTKFYDKGNT